MVLNRREIQLKANLIWSIADKIHDVYKPHEYGKVILPLTVIKRFNDCLVDTKEELLKRHEELIKKNTAPTLRDAQLERITGYKFYNYSKFTFTSLLDDSDNIESNFKNFLGGFSDNVQDIIQNFEFNIQIEKMARSGVLYEVIKAFNGKESDFSPANVSAVDMGYVFEELVRRFSESYNEDAGAHFTSRDIIYLLTDILLLEDRELLIDEGVVKTCYDMTMGTSQMLACLTERLKDLDSEASVECFGQEINAETFAIAKSDMLIKGENTANMRQGNTLSDDKFKGYTFDYIISNPPFGVEWKVEKDAVEAEAKSGEKGRFGIGLPGIDDGQMLFTLNGISKLKEDGRMAIIHSGSVLFSGDAGSGPSKIRQYLIENDYLEAVIQLPKDLFYNTGISTYVLIITKQKAPEREGRIQLVDASLCFEKRRKAIGNKRVDISDHARELILRAYHEMQNTTYQDGELVVKTKWFKNEDFGFNKIVVERPLRLAFQTTNERIKLLKENKGFIGLATSKKKGEAGQKEMADGELKQKGILNALAVASTEVFLNRETFKSHLNGLFKTQGIKSLSAAQWKFIFNVFGERNETADICLDGKGNKESDSELRDTETVPLTETIEEYMVREVLPYAPDAWVDETKTKVGYEIPFTRHFYEYVPLRPSQELLTEIIASEEKISALLKELLGNE